jgi:hypothetical protein
MRSDIATVTHCAQRQKHIAHPSTLTSPSDPSTPIAHFENRASRIGPGISPSDPNRHIPVEYGPRVASITVFC